MNNLKENNSKKKTSKHCIFDSKKNSEFVYLKSEQNDLNNNEVGKIIDNINKKAEKGINIGEKKIFSNYKGLREHNNQNL